MLIQVPIEKLQNGMIAQQDIITPTEGTLIVTKGTKLSDLIIRKLNEYGIEHVLIDISAEYLGQHPQAISQIEMSAPVKLAESNHVKHIPPPPTEIAPVIQSHSKPNIQLPEIKPIINEELREEAVGSIRNMFSMVNENKTAENMTTAYTALKEIDDIVDKLIDTLSEEENSLVYIADLKKYDEYTYHHSLSVAVLSIAIGQGMGFSDYEVRQLGRCAILHDIGKVFIPTEIINKSSKLTEEEFETAKKHTSLSSECIAKWNMGDISLRLGALTHHEKIDGTGYPNGLRGEKIPLWGRIISVADVYDAITSYRSYRSPMTPAEAVDLIMGQVGTAFDYEVVRVFIDKLVLYPINTCLELSNKRFGIVIDNEYQMRPIIRMTDNDEIVDLMGLDNLSTMIVRVVD